MIQCMLLIAGAESDSDTSVHNMLFYGVAMAERARVNGACPSEHT